MTITKAIIPAAGRSTRFLPASNAVSKEMLPILDKPAIQYILEEGCKAGIKNFAIVTNTKHSPALMNHLTPMPEREYVSIDAAQQASLASLRKTLYSADMSYVLQHEPLGLGHAVWSARHAIGREHCAIMLPDDILTGQTAAIGQLIKIAQQERCNVVAVQEVSGKDISKYGVVSIKKQFSPNLFQVKELVEKPSPTQAPSNLAIVGRYVLSPQIFDVLEQLNANAVGDIELTDAIQSLLFAGEKVFAYKIQGARYDIGDPLGYIKANISLALKSGQYSDEMWAYLQSIDQEMLMMQGKAEILSRQGSL